MSDFKKFKEELPSKKKFYSSLTDKKISDKEHEHVFQVWNKFEMKIMKDYQDLHLKCDVLLLTDVFEKFRNNSLKNYRLCQSHYSSVPVLSWDVMLNNMTKVELELIPDPDMFIFFDKVMRGGVSNRYSISNRYSKVDNKCLKSYDPKHVIYLDANNWYGYAMSKFLPTSISSNISS